MNKIDIADSTLSFKISIIEFYLWIKKYMCSNNNKYNFFNINSRWYFKQKDAYNFEIYKKYPRLTLFTYLKMECVEKNNLLLKITLCFNIFKIIINAIIFLFYILIFIIIILKYNLYILSYGLFIALFLFAIIIYNSLNLKRDFCKFLNQEIISEDLSFTLNELHSKYSDNVKRDKK